MCRECRECRECMECECGVGSVGGLERVVSVGSV